MICPAFVEEMITSLDDTGLAGTAEFAGLTNVLLEDS